MRHAHNGPFSPPSVAARVAPSCVRKHSVIVGGHKTSISLDALAWERLRTLAARRHLSVTALIESIESTREGRNRSRAIRAFLEAQKLNERFGRLMIGARSTPAASARPADDLLIG